MRVIHPCKEDRHPRRSELSNSDKTTLCSVSPTRCLDYFGDLFRVMNSREPIVKTRMVDGSGTVTGSNL